MVMVAIGISRARFPNGIVFPTKDLRPKAQGRPTERNMTTDHHAHDDTLTTRRLTGAIGAEIMDLDLTAPEYDNIYPAIHQAFLDHAVLVLRNQDLSPEQLIKVSKRFGKLESHVLSQFNMKGHPEVLLISNVKEEGKPIGAIHAGQYWHSDLSYTDRPTQASLLHAKEIPSYGGDTSAVTAELASGVVSVHG